MASMSVEDAIAQTENKAQALLFDREGKPHKHKRYVASLLWHTVLRSAKTFVKTDYAKEGTYAFRWHGDLVIYDPAEAEIAIWHARGGDPTSDELLCNAAAMILDATGGIADKSLRDYICGRLMLGAPQPTPKKGRSAEKNRWRDVCIQGWLIPPLLPGFPATRNEATKTESACSIVSKALKNIGIKLSEKGVANVWNARPSSMKAE
jgi:hypothetical protein